MEGVKTDGELLEADFFEKKEFFADVCVVLCPESVGFERVERRQVFGGGVFEQGGQMVKIKKWFAAGDMDMGSGTGQIEQGGPDLKGCLAGHQPFRVRAAIVRAKAASR